MAPWLTLKVSMTKIPSDTSWRLPPTASELHRSILLLTIYLLCGFILALGILLYRAYFANLLPSLSASLRALYAIVHCVNICLEKNHELVTMLQDADEIYHLTSQTPSGLEYGVIIYIYIPSTHPAFKFRSNDPHCRRPVDHFVKKYV